MASVPQTKPQAIEAPGGPAVLSGTHPSLSSLTPTPLIDIDPASESDSPSQDEPSPVPEIGAHAPGALIFTLHSRASIVVDSIESPDASDVPREPHAVAATSSLSARRTTSSGKASGMLKVLGKQRVMSAAVDRIKERCGKVNRLISGVLKNAGLLPDLVESLFDGIDPMLSQDASSAPSPQNSALALVAAQLSSPAFTAKVVQLEEHVNGIRASIAEIETALKELQADVGEIKLDCVDIEMASVLKGWAAHVQAMNPHLDGVAKTLQLCAAVRATAARFQPLGESV